MIDETNASHVTDDAQRTFVPMICDLVALVGFWVKQSFQPTNINLAVPGLLDERDVTYPGHKIYLLAKHLPHQIVRKVIRITIHRSKRSFNQLIWDYVIDPEGLDYDSYYRLWSDEIQGKQWCGLMDWTEEPRIFGILPGDSVALSQKAGDAFPQPNPVNGSGLAEESTYHLTNTELIYIMRFWIARCIHNRWNVNMGNLPGEFDSHYEESRYIQIADLIGYPQAQKLIDEAFSDLDCPFKELEYQDHFRQLKCDNAALVAVHDIGGAMKILSSKCTCYG